MRLDPVFLRKRISVSQPRPVGPDRRVVPAQALVAFRGITRRYLVVYDRVRFERAEAVREAGRNPEQVAFGGAQLDRGPLAKGGGTGAQVDRDVENRVGRASYQLALGLRVGLEMQSAHHTCTGTERLVLLHEGSRPCLFVKIPVAKQFGEIAARVTVAAGSTSSRWGMAKAENCMVGPEASKGTADLWAGRG